MESINLIGVLSGAVPILIFIYVHVKRAEDKKRLNKLLQENDYRSSKRSVIGFTKEKVLKLVRPFLPSPATLSKMQLNLIRANIKYSAEEFYAFRLCLAITLGTLMALLYIPNVTNMLIYGGAAAGACYILPQNIVMQKVKGRQRQAQHEVLDFIDLVANGTEAGLDLNNSIDKVTRQMPGIISEEFQIAYSEIDLGRRRSEAFKDLANRLEVEDVTLLIDAILQAEKTGVGMATVLKDQAQRIRLKYKTNALKMAQAASVKMLVPMILFIIPALFIVVLGPPFIGIGDLLKF